MKHRLLGSGWIEKANMSELDIAQHFVQDQTALRRHDRLLMDKFKHARGRCGRLDGLPKENTERDCKGP